MNFYFRKLLESRTPEIYSTGYKIVSDLDDLQDNLGMPSFLLCFMRQLAADQMAGPSAVTYLALVDEASCSADSQVAQVPRRHRSINR